MGATAQCWRGSVSLHAARLSGDALSVDVRHVSHGTGPVPDGGPAGTAERSSLPVNFQMTFSWRGQSPLLLCSSPAVVQA